MYDIMSNTLVNVVENTNREYTASAVKKTIVEPKTQSDKIFFTPFFI